MGNVMLQAGLISEFLTEETTTASPPARGRLAAFVKRDPPVMPVGAKSYASHLKK